MEKIIISIEGNIGSGKSTLLQCLRELVPELTIVPEPVLDWESLQTEEKRGLLESFYHDQKTYAFQLQMHALLTRFQAIHVAVQSNETVVAERSILTDRSVFAHVLEKAGCLSVSEGAILDRWAQYFSSQLPETFVIYIRTPVEVCHERIRQRARGGEEEITLDYLTQIHEHHEKLFGIHAKREYQGKVLILDGLHSPLSLAQELVEMIHIRI